MGLFSREDSKVKAKEEYEKATALTGSSREVLGERMRMGLRARAHLDKSFIEGAEKFERYDEICLQATALGRDKPPPPKVTMFQTVKSINGEIRTYIPEEIAEQAFKLGAQYQLTKIDAKTAIDLCQNLMDTLAFELNLDDKLSALGFLREEISYYLGDEEKSDDESHNTQENQTSDD